MRQTLELRLATAEAERKAAEHEKLEKEEAAQQALAEQEVIMDKVVQESKVLQQQAEENTKVSKLLRKLKFLRRKQKNDQTTWLGILVKTSKLIFVYKVWT